jgi:catechol 2,3-dioxygenase-like lactoylglutathione lyase family enzyme
MTVKRIDNVDINVEDLDAAVDFFTELGMKLEGRMPSEGSFAERITGLKGLRTEIAMMRTPDGSGLELTKWNSPAGISAEPKVPSPNTLGIGRIMFAVEDIDDVVARLRTKGGELMGEIVNYENVHRLCYMRGPEGIIIALAEKIG